MSVRLSPNHKPKPTGRKLAGRLVFRGLPISLEHQVGDVRRWTDERGNSGETLMRHRYGYVPLTRGRDGDHCDVYVGPHEDSDLVVVVRQLVPETGAYDEDKALLAFRTVEEALAAYDAQYDRPGFRGEHLVLTWAEFAAHCIDRSTWGLPIQKAIEQELEKAKASRASWRKSVRKYEANPANKSKTRAKWRVQSAVRSGELKKPDHCPRCKRKVPLQYHHSHGYAEKNWLRGVWRCRQCHVREDNSLSNRNGKMSRSVKRAQKGD